MSYRSLFKPTPVITNGSMAGNIVGTPTIIQVNTIMSYSFTWTGTTPVGEISVQVSNDYRIDAQGNVSNAGTWNTLTLNVGGSAETSVPVSGNSGNGLIDVLQTGAYAIRPVYTRTSGTGTLNSLFTAKVA